MYNSMLWWHMYTYVRYCMYVFLLCLPICIYLYSAAGEPNAEGSDANDHSFEAVIDMVEYDDPTQHESPNIAFQPTSLWGHLPSPTVAKTDPVVRYALDAFIDHMSWIMSYILCIYIQSRGGGPAPIRAPGQNGPERFTSKGASCSSKGAWC